MYNNIYKDNLELEKKINDKIIKELKSKRNPTRAKKEIKDFVSSETSKIDVEKNVDDMIEVTTYGFDEALRPGGIKVNPRTYSKIKKQLVDTNFAVYREIEKTSQVEYLRMFKKVNAMIASEGITTQQAVNSIVKENGFKGAFITYSNGNRYPFNKYLNMNFRTTQKDIAIERGKEIAKELNTDVYEVSSHANPRKSCATIQGKYITYASTTKTIKSFGGTTIKATPITSVSGYGTAGGFLGINCRHVLYPVQNGFIERKEEYEADEEQFNKDIDKLNKGA